jgi:TPR repeat protein
MAKFDRAMAEYITERLSAADGGQVEAIYDLGLLYSTGQGVDLDLIEAHKWFNLAAMKGLQRAAVDRSDLAREMSTGEIADAQRQAREWQKAH